MNIIYVLHYITFSITANLIFIYNQQEKNTVCRAVGPSGSVVYDEDTKTYILKHTNMFLNPSHHPFFFFFFKFLFLPQPAVKN